MVGGFLIGAIETFVKGYISSSWANVFVFGVLIIVLLVKPTGLFGKNVKEKV
jgi:branched-chain amino acid transport system permease protein